VTARFRGQRADGREAGRFFRRSARSPSAVQKAASSACFFSPSSHILRTTRFSAAAFTAARRVSKAEGSPAINPNKLLLAACFGPLCSGQFGCGKWVDEPHEAGSGLAVECFRRASAPGAKEQRRYRFKVHRALETRFADGRISRFFRVARSFREEREHRNAQQTAV
jgi:hypothetical protein